MADPTAFDEVQDKEINALKAKVDALEQKLDRALDLIGAQQQLLQPLLKLKSDVDVFGAHLGEALRKLDLHDGRFKPLEEGLEYAKGKVRWIMDWVQKIEKKLGL